MRNRPDMPRALASAVAAALIIAGSVGATAPDVAHAKKKQKVVVADVLVCKVLKFKVRSGASLGRTVTRRSNDKALKDPEKYLIGSCEERGIPTV